MFKHILDIVWGFCFYYNHGTTYSTKSFGECEQLENYEKRCGIDFL